MVLARLPNLSKLNLKRNPFLSSGTEWKGQDDIKFYHFARAHKKAVALVVPSCMPPLVRAAPRPSSKAAERDAAYRSGSGSRVASSEVVPVIL